MAIHKIFQNVEIQGMLKVTGTHGAYVKLPVLTTTMRDALVAEAGMVVFNSTTTQMEDYDGSNWQPTGYEYFLPLTGGTMTGGLLIGETGSSRLTQTYNGSKALQVYTTCASTDGSTNWEPQRFDNEATGIGQVGCRFMVNLSTDVRLGSWANAFKAQVECNDGGGAGGLLSVGCFEMALPTGGVGALACIELEMTAPDSGFAVGQNFPSYIFANCTGSTVEGFRDGGVFVHFDAGNVAATGNLIGDSYSTIRLAFGNAASWTNYYIPLSTAEGSFTTVKPIVSTYEGGTAIQIGSSGTPVDLAISGQKALAIYADTELSSGDQMATYLYYSIGGAGSEGQALRAILNIADVNAGGSEEAIYAIVTCNTSGQGTGIVSALRGMITLPNQRMTAGTYAPLVAEISCPTSFACGDAPVTFLRMVVSGAGIADFNDNATLFTVETLVDDTNHLYYDETLRIQVNTSNRYIPLSTVAGTLTFAGDAVFGDGDVSIYTWGTVIVEGHYLYMNDDYSASIASLGNNLLRFFTTAGTIGFQCGDHGEVVAITNDGLSTAYRITAGSFQLIGTGSMILGQMSTPVTPPTDEGSIWYNITLDKLQFRTAAGIETVTSVAV